MSWTNIIPETEGLYFVRVNSGPAPLVYLCRIDKSAPRVESYYARPEEMKMVPGFTYAHAIYPRHNDFWSKLTGMENFSYWPVSTPPDYNG